MENKEKALLKKMRAGQFVDNNGRVLRTINLLRYQYSKLTDVQYALDDIPEDQLLDSVNFLESAGYIVLRHHESKTVVQLADAEYTELEAKLSATGIRLLGGEIIDKMVNA